MKYKKKKRGRFEKVHAAGVTEWGGEVNNLRKTAILLWQELQTLESLYCLEIKDKIDFFEEVRKYEMRLIKYALLKTGGRQKESARLLGVSASNLNNKIKRYRIPSRVSASSAISKFM